MRYVVDASVVLAFLGDEAGGGRLAGPDDQFVLSSVNLAEVLTKLVDRELSIDDAMRVLRRLPVEIVEHAAADARDAAMLRADTRHLGLSLGDRACLALARRLDLAVLTADAIWTRLSIGIDIRLIR